MRNRWAAVFFAIFLVSAEHSLAIYFAPFEGVTNVTSPVAPIRSGWYDDPIIFVVESGDELIVHEMTGYRLHDNGVGKWLRVTVRKNTRITGYIDARQTSFSEDLKKGLVKQPK